MPKIMGKKTDRNNPRAKYSDKDLEAVKKIKFKPEPVAYAFKVGTNISEEFYSFEDAAKFFKVTTPSVYARACNKDSNVIGLNIGEKWLITNANYKRFDLQERWCGLVCV